jgi:hypothetical protein
MAYNFLPTNYNKEHSITSCCRILPSFYYSSNRFGIKIYKGNQMGTNITPMQSVHLNLVLDEVNHVYFALSKSAVKPILCSLTILATSYSPLPLEVQKRITAQLPLHKTLTYILIINQQLCLSSSNSLLQCQQFAVAMWRTGDPAFLFVWLRKVPTQFITVYCK